MGFANWLRVCTLLVISLGAVQDLFVVYWYVHHAFATPRRVMHVASVGIGLGIGYGAMAAEIARLVSEDAPLGWTSPLLIASVLFVMTGVHFLYLDTKKRVVR